MKIIMFIVSLFDFDVKGLRYERRRVFGMQHTINTPGLNMLVAVVCLWVALTDESKDIVLGGFGGFIFFVGYAIYCRFAYRK
jgi:hypothetical protein